MAYQGNQFGPPPGPPKKVRLANTLIWVLVVYSAISFTVSYYRFMALGFGRTWWEVVLTIIMWIFLIVSANYIKKGKAIGRLFFTIYFAVEMISVLRNMYYFIGEGFYVLRYLWPFLPPLILNILIFVMLYSDQGKEWFSSDHEEGMLS